jgi:uncharacterized protein YndB with AHSA1/START domain
MRVNDESYSFIKTKVMITKHRARFTKNADGKKITVVKEFDADVEQVWKAWTTREQLDNWWAPKPWKAVTKKMDFKEGGTWLYKMAGPNGEQQWASFEYKKIDAPHYFIAADSFTDENGNRDTKMPSQKWKNTFTKTNEGTKVEVELSFEKKEDMDKILQMGFEEGFTSGLDNLDDLLSR